MVSPEQWVFADQHSADNFDKVDGHNHYSMVAHYLQRLVAQVLDMIVGMAVVEIEPALVVGPFVVDQYWMIDQDEESQYLFEPESLQIRRHYPEIVIESLRQEAFVMQLEKLGVNIQQVALVLATHSP